MIYLASPYTHPDLAVRELRFKQACQYVGNMLKKGIHVFSPIVYTHPITIECALPTVWSFWANLDQDFLLCCDKVQVLTLEGWRESAGIESEINAAKRLGIPIEYVEPIV